MKNEDEEKKVMKKKNPYNPNDEKKRKINQKFIICIMCI